MTLRTLIADDEPLARERMRSLLGAFEDVSCVAEAGSGDEVMALVRQHKPDLLFLDIRMPGLSGLDIADLLRSCVPKPLVVFVTAYDQHALEAFELEALDYLTKPVRPSRLAKTLERARERRLTLAVPPEPNALPGLPQQPTNPIQDLLGVPVGEKTELVDLDQLLYVLMTEGSLELHTSSRVFHTSWQLKRMEDRLEGDPRFLKISRQCLIQLRHLKAIDPYFSGTSKLLMADGARLEASRAATKKLMSLVAPAPDRSGPAKNH